MRYLVVKLNEKVGSFSFLSSFSFLLRVCVGGWGVGFQFLCVTSLVVLEHAFEAGLEITDPPVSASQIHYHHLA